MQPSTPIDHKSIIMQAPKVFKTLKGVKTAFHFAASLRRKQYLNYGYAIEQAAARYPDNVLIKYNDRVVRYRKFNEQANKAAHYLVAKGIKPGDVVALFMENRPEYLCYMAAIAKIGAVAALINNSQSGKVLVHSLNLVSAKAVITGEEVVSAIDVIKKDGQTDAEVLIVPDPDSQWLKENPEQGYTNLEEECSTYPVDNLEQTKKIEPDSPCLYVYTSGTTGLPKASIQKHKKIMGIYLGLGMFIGRMDVNDTVYSSLPLYHATALYLCWLPALANGASIAIRKKFSASEFWSDVRKFDATAFGYVGELCRYLMNQPPSHLDKQHSVRMVTGNGLRPDLWNDFKSRFGIEEVREFYGASEGNIVCYNLFNQNQTVGMTLGSYAIVRFDNETEMPVKNASGMLIKVDSGESGLLLGRITKITPFDGYTDESKNQGKVFRDIFEEGDAWFNTGDIVKDIGCRHLQFVDRTGDTYRWKGENVSTTEVEMIVNQHESIAESIAYGVEIPSTNGRAGMVAITFKDKDHQFDGKELFSRLSAELPNYAVPLFVRMLESVDATGTFKYQRTHLKSESYLTKKSDVYVALPSSKEYVLINADIIDGIEKGNYRF